MEKILKSILEFLETVLDYKVVNEFGSVEANGEVVSECLAISFKNTGDQTAYVNGFPLKSGDPMLSFSSPGMDTTKYRIKFEGVGTKQLHYARQIKAFKIC